MKILVLLAMILVSPLTAESKERLTLAAGQEVRLQFSPDQITEVALHTSEQAGVDVRVERISDKSFIRGFGMSKGSKEKVLVEGNAVLVLINPSSTSVELEYETSKANPTPKSTKAGVNLTFYNGSLSSIPLIIPGVMNPNLYPMSNSGVTLSYGQKVFFVEKGERYLLFEVDDSFKEGDRLEIQNLIKARKKQLGI